MPYPAPVAILPPTTMPPPPPQRNSAIVLQSPTRNVPVKSRPSTPNSVHPNVTVPLTPVELLGGSTQPPAHVAPVAAPGTPRTSPPTIAAAIPPQPPAPTVPTPPPPHQLAYRTWSKARKQTLYAITTNPKP